MKENIIDIHSHIIAGIDDGPKYLNVALEMIKRAESLGTKDIVATPHFRRGYFETPFNEVKIIANYLKSLVKEEGLNINIHYGQEVYFSERILEDLEKGIIGTIDEGRYMLLEFPMRKIPKEAVDYIYEINLKGITPIIAHPERYLDVVKNPERLNELIEEGCLFQLNAGSIRGDFGRDIKKTSEILIKHGIYGFIGSDAHDNNRRKTGILEECKEVFKKNKNLEEIFMENTEKLLKNENIFFEGEKIKKRGFF